MRRLSFPDAAISLRPRGRAPAGRRGEGGVGARPPRGSGAKARAAPRPRAVERSSRSPSAGCARTSVVRAVGSPRVSGGSCWASLTLREGIADQSASGGKRRWKCSGTPNPDATSRGFWSRRNIPSMTRSGCVISSHPAVMPGRGGGGEAVPARSACVPRGARASGVPSTRPWLWRGDRRGRDPRNTPGAPGARARGARSRARLGAQPLPGCPFASPRLPLPVRPDRGLDQTRGVASQHKDSRALEKRCLGHTSRRREGRDLFRGPPGPRVRPPPVPPRRGRRRY